MATQVTNYQCPACTGPLHFVGASGQLECDYCGSTYPVDEIEALYAEKEAEAAAAFSQETEKETAASQEDDMWSPEGMKAYSCPSCGAEIVCDETTAATSCVYCGNPTVVPGQFGGMLKPDYIIPFKLDKEAAVAALKRYYRGKPLLPKAFSAGNHIEEIKGVYVPFWLFDGEAQGNVTFDATRTHTYTEGDYEVTKTEHFRAERVGGISFERVPADGSSKMPDAHMDAIEPFDYNEMTDFSTAYLPGFLADKYDVTPEQSRERIEERVTNSFVDMMRDTVVGYSGVTMLDKNVTVKSGKTKYAMLPVWMLHTKWKNKDFLFAMNGQTGKLIGDLPVSWGRFIAMLAGISVPLMVILGLILLL